MRLCDCSRNWKLHETRYPIWGTTSPRRPPAATNPHSHQISFQVSSQLAEPSSPQRSRRYQNRVEGLQMPELLWDFETGRKSTHRGVDRINSQANRTHPHCICGEAGGAKASKHCGDNLIENRTEQRSLHKPWAEFGHSRRLQSYLDHLPLSQEWFALQAKDLATATRWKKSWSARHEKPSSTQSGRNVAREAWQNRRFSDIFLRKRHGWRDTGSRHQTVHSSLWQSTKANGS